MRAFIVTKSGDSVEGTILLKDESFIMVKVKKNKVRVFHWEHILDVKRVVKGEYQSVNLDFFKKIRE